MCGIVGVVGQENSFEFILEGLKKLEYRGYDSFGYALASNKKIIVKKIVGKISDYSEKNFIESKLGIGHTRWATHGSVSIKNAHPHLSNNKKIAVVHNGIVENYDFLKKELEKKGFIFCSQTDTEVIPNLIQFFMKKKPFEEAVRITAKKLKGYFAFIALTSNKNSLVLAANGSPLTIGLAENSFYAASDVTAFISKTKKAIFMEDNEMAILNNTISIKKIDSNKKVSPKIVNLTWSAEQAEKAGKKYFMEKEILEQPKTIISASIQDKTKLEKAVRLIKRAELLFFLGCGTSYFACEFGSILFSKKAGRLSIPVLASEHHNYKAFAGKKSVFFALSQSGETADLLEAIKEVKQKNTKIISLTNNASSTLARISDIVLPLNCGPEICVLSTKSYTSQLVILLTLYYHYIGKKEKTGQLMRKISLFAEKTIRENIKKTKKLAEKLANKKNMFVIGKAEQCPTAKEAALKIKEVSYIHTEGFPGAELKHGTLALIEKNTPVIVVSDNNTRNKILGNAMEIKARGGKIVGVDSQNNKAFDYWLKVPDSGKATPILSIIPIQLLAYNLALQKGLDPDKPRNLAKSVTVK